mgnify:CR=1 FL=1
MSVGRGGTGLKEGGGSKDRDIDKDNDKDIENQEIEKIANT